MAIHVVDQKQVGGKMITGWMIPDEGALEQLPTDEKYIGSMAHTPGYEQIWELSEEGWVEL